MSQANEASNDMKNRAFRFQANGVGYITLRTPGWWLTYRDVVCFVLKKGFLKQDEIIVRAGQEKHFQKKTERQNDLLKFKPVRSSDMKLV